MAYEFKFPDVGEGITEGEIHKWRVKEGDRVNEHDIIAEVETDKAIVEIPSPKAGTVLQLNFKEGDTVNVGQTLAIIGEAGEKVELEAVSDRLAEALRPQKAVAVVGSLEEAPEEKPTKSVAIQSKGEGGALATPVVRKLAKDLGIDINAVKGTGTGGRTTEEDVRKASESGARIAQPPVSAPSEAVIAPEAPKVIRKYDMYGYIERVPFKGVRKSIAKHLTEGVRNAALVTGMDSVDVTELFNHREREKVSAEANGIKLTYLPFIVKAVIGGLKVYPQFNSSVDGENDEIIVKKYYNIGIAVQTDSGLIVPVIKNADTKSILDIAKEIKDLSDKAKTRTLDLGDMKGGTFSITNYGSTGGGWFATPLPNFPEVAILGVGMMRDMPVVRKGSVQIRKLLPLSLTFDHRVVDGALATEFMIEIAKRLEDPDLPLLGD